MPDPYRRQAIVEAFRSRLQAIEIGPVFLNETPTLGPDDPAIALAVLIGDDTPRFQGERILLTLPVEIQILAKADLDEPWLAVERTLGEVKKGIELADRTLGGAVLRQIERGVTRTLPRELGSTTVGAGLTYLAPYPESWGKP